MTDQEAFDQLSYYTLSHGGSDFIHQYIVDTFAAQHATGESKPIYVAFALAGLYLRNEKNYSGKEVQRAHMALAKRKQHLPIFVLPIYRGNTTVVDVLSIEPGKNLDEAIEKWSASTWEALAEVHQQVAKWLQSELDL